MWNQFLLENLHFTIYLFAALVFFAVSWLYYDAWRESPRLIEGVRVIGFLVLSISFLIAAAFLESSVLKTSLLPENQNLYIQLIPRVLGYFLILMSVLFEKLQEKPKIAESLIMAPLVGSSLIGMQIL